jgi:hypothetical protein
MSAISDKARDFWNRISPRERRLVVIAAISAPIVLAIWLGLEIRDGLATMEARNAKMRKALVVLADLRVRGDQGKSEDDVVSMMTTEPISLDTYLDDAAKKAQFTLKGTTPHPAVTRNGFVTNSVSCTLDDLSIDQLKSFLTEVETGSRVVAITHIDLRRDFRNKDKIDVNLEVSTYSLEPKAQTDAAPKKGG